MKHPSHVTGNPPNHPDSDRLINLRAVQEMVGCVSRTTIWRLQQVQGFPRPVAIGARHLWSAREVGVWINGQITARDTGSTEAA